MTCPHMGWLGFRRDFGEASDLGWPNIFLNLILFNPIQGKYQMPPKALPSDPQQTSF